MRAGLSAGVMSTRSGRTVKPVLSAIPPPGPGRKVKVTRKVLPVFKPKDESADKMSDGGDTTDDNSAVDEGDVEMDEEDEDVFARKKGPTKKGKVATFAVAKESGNSIFGTHYTTP